MASLVIYGEDSSVPVEIFSVNMLTGGTPTSLGTGTVNSLIDHTDFLNNPISTLYLLIRVGTSHATNHTIYGGVMYDDLGATESDFIIRPADFLIAE